MTTALIVGGVWVYAVVGFGLAMFADEWFGIEGDGAIWLGLLWGIAIPVAGPWFLYAYVAGRRELKRQRLEAQLAEVDRLLEREGVRRG